MNFTSRTAIVWTARVITLFVVGILLMANYISLRHFFRIDLTRSQSFAIDASSKAVLRGLPDIVSVKVFFSRQLPPNLVAVRQYVSDVLEEFESYAAGNINVRFFDPADEAVADEARRLGIPAVRMNILSKDKFEVQSGFLGVALMYGDRHEALPVIQNALNVEYDLIAAIAKLTNPDLKHVAFLTGHNEYPIVAARGISRGNGYVLANAALSKHYRVSTVSLGQPKALDTVDTLIIGGPEIAFTEPEKRLLDQYLMDGGNMVLLLDGANVPDFYEASELDLNLNDLLAHYGASVEPVLALDTLNEPVGFDETDLALVVPYPFWIKAVSDHFDPKHAITRRLDALTFPWASPLNLVGADGVTAHPLIRTSASAWTQAAPFNLDPATEPPFGGGTSYTLAALLEGRFNSFYVGARGLSPSSSGKGRIFLVGNSQFLTDRMIRQYKQNLDFFLNAVDFLTLNSTLSSIRSKSVSDRPLIKLSDAERQGVKLAGIFLMPALVVLYGVLRSIERRNKKIKW